MISFSPKDKSVPELMNYLQAGVAPRPIAFASTVDKDGNPNLSPFSFFNIFGSNPPTLIFSPARRVRDNTIKHTLENVMEVPEVVINVVNYAMVQQASLSSTEYPKGVNEFEKAGFTAEPSETVRPFRVKESPMQLECVVKQIIETGNEGGAGNLIICEIKRIHVSESVLDEKGQIDQQKIDLVARLGGNWYSRASGSALFEVVKPLTTLGIGVDALPEKIRLSTVLTGNDLGRLGNVEQLPTPDEIQDFLQSGQADEICSALGFSSGEMGTRAHEIAHKLLENERTDEAWKILLAAV
ncbi:MAG: flavin reductase family protein [Flavobacteriales bacterium]|nr:flavin reductase family protein [Flavobacteriales bacterium]